MAIRRITKYGAPVLNKKLKPAKFEDIREGLDVIIEDMWETLLLVKGLGISANQVGLELRMAVLAIKNKEEMKRMVIINPTIVERSGEMTGEEGCLSLPGLFADVTRSQKVVVRALNEKGVPIEVTATGMLARLFQHEIDHLDGKVFVDRLTPLGKIQAKAAIKKFRKQWAEMDETKIKPDEDNISGNARRGGSVPKAS